MKFRFFEIVRMPQNMSQTWSMGFYRNEEVANKETIRLNQLKNEWLYVVMPRFFVDDK